MKVGILTRRYGYNMGSSLQAFAMAEMIKNLGHDVKIINYDESSAHPRWRIRPIIDQALYYTRFILPRKLRAYLKHRHNQENRFKKFENTYFPITNKKISSSKKLAKIAVDFDKIVIGSDQIWNPFFFDPNFLGSFLDKSQRQNIVPYAPSIGTSDMSLITDYEKELLKTLPIISCREKEGANIIKSITGKNVEVVLDPTLMVSKQTWKSIADKHAFYQLKTAYVLTYFLGADIPFLEIERQSKCNNAIVINISMFNRPNDVKADINFENVGPGEFLYLIKNAECILTDSFHATIFSWIFSRKFTVFERFKKNDIRNENSRIYTLLNIIGKESNLYGADLEDSEPIVKEKLELSKKYLDKNLS